MSAAAVPENTFHPHQTPPPGTTAHQVLSLAGQLFAAVGVYNRGPRTVPVAPPNITDPYTDLLAFLDPPRRRGMIAWIANRYYEGWRPDRDEIGDLVAVELGVLRVEESIDRQHRRHSGTAVPDILPRIRNRIANQCPAPPGPLHPRLTPLPTQRTTPAPDLHRDDPPPSPAIRPAREPGSPAHSTG